MSFSSTITPEPATDRPDGEDRAKQSDGMKASFGLTGLVIFVLVLGGLFILKRRCTKSSSSSSSKAEDSDEISSVFVQEDQFVRHTQNWDDTQTGRALKESIKHILIDSKRLQLQSVLGQGQFGCVYSALLSKGARRSNDYGDLSHEKVAVKVIRDDEEVKSSTVEGFLKEGLLMKDLTHPNVLTLLGVTIGKRGLPMIVLPYMHHGNLKTYLSNTTLMITVRSLLEFGLQIARGMEYLSKQKFVHRDLALRNCMLDESSVVKVADFGLSRDIYHKDYYSSHDKQAMLPVKWMAIESLTKSVYTTHSDVWSYGVVLWELMTRGALPYPDISNWEVRSYVQTGRRLHQPESCPKELFEWMQRCWLSDPDQRPTFTDLVNFIQRTLELHPRRREGCYTNILQTPVDLPTPPPIPVTKPDLPTLSIA